MPETFFTVWTNVFQRGRLARGETLLVHGGSSGIGTTAIQLATGIRGACLRDGGLSREMRGVRTPGGRSCDQLSSRRTSSRSVRELTAGRGVDVVLDMVGAPYLARNLDALAVDGRLVQIAMLGGDRAELKLSAILRRRLTITGSTLRPRSVAEKGAIARELEEKVWPLVERGVVSPVVHATFPLRAAADAHRLLESGVTIGKVILTVQEA